MADFEGLKLDFLILQKQIEENTRLLSTINAQNENASCTELLDCKKKCETLLCSVSKKRQCNQRAGQEEKCLIFESCVLSLEQEADSLRLALTISMQEKSEADNNQSRSRECWVQVDKSRGKNEQAKRSQKSVHANSTETRNNFEPLRHNVEIEVGNVANQKAHSGDNDQQTPWSLSSSQGRTRKTMQPVSTESVTNGHDQPQPKCWKKVILAGVTALKYVQSHKISRNLQVKIATFPGCTTQHMKADIKPVLRRNPDQVINETNLDLTIDDAEFYLPGYKFMRKDRARNGRNGGGDCFYVRCNLTYKVRDDC